VSKSNLINKSNSALCTFGRTHLIMSDKTGVIMGSNDNDDVMIHNKHP
jgi:hypothetical protein